MKRTKHRIVVWGYDIFPFCIAGRAVGEDEEGYKLDPKAWGHGFKLLKHHAIAVFPLKEGLAVKKRLEQLSRDHRDAVSLVNEAFRARLIAILPEMKKELK